MDTSKQLAALRELMSSYADGPLDAWVVPTDDAHASEYVAPCDGRRSFISGFDGSAGVAIVRREGGQPESALLFTDGRYFNQAAQQLSGDWKLMKRGEKDVPTWQEYLAKLPENSRIGLDPTLLGIQDAKDIRKSLKPRDSTLVSVLDNLVDRVWGSDRPSRPANPITVHSVKRAGQRVNEKIAALRKIMAEKKAAALFVSALDDVAWLLNIRGSDIDYNPTPFAYVLLTEDKITLFAQESAIDGETRQYLADERVEVAAYGSVVDALRSYGGSLDGQRKVLVGQTASLAVAEAVGLDKIEVVRSPVAELKAIKNSVELAGFRACHIRDGAALCAFFAWLEEQLHGGVELDEAQAADKLEAYRAQQDLFRGLSFTTISSTGSNAAIIHYAPPAVGSAKIDRDQIYLCDSGGQYTDGTTDVTRTLHFGEPTAEEIEAFTLVLKGHIALAELVFPYGLSGYQLDSFARAALWKYGLDYAHGTGHGVGSFLNVHEGPHSISARLPSNLVPLREGMVVSNEPGYYADGSFGIRIESLVVVKEVHPPHNFGKKTWLGFETITWAPIQTSLVDAALLTPGELTWLNDYNAKTLETLRPVLKDDARAIAWLERECKPLGGGHGRSV